MGLGFFFYAQLQAPASPELNSHLCSLFHVVGFSPFPFLRLAKARELRHGGPSILSRGYQAASVLQGCMVALAIKWPSVLSRSYRISAAIDPAASEHGLCARAAAANLDSMPAHTGKGGGGV